MKEKEGPQTSDYIMTIVRRRKIIIRNIVVVTIAAIIISLVLQKKYTAKATLLPPNTNQDMMFGLLPAYSYTAGTGLSSLARLGGIVPGVATPSELYAAIMKSNTVRQEIISGFDLRKEFKTKSMHDTYKALDEITKITISAEGIIEIDVTYKNKYLAADIANAYVEELDKFNTETAMTVGKKYRIFIEDRLKVGEDSLLRAEEALRNFQEQNRTVALDVEIKAAIETIAQLKSKIILYEVQKGAWATAGKPNNPYLTNINTELRELRKQLSRIEFGGQGQKSAEFGAGFSVPFSKLPEVSLEYARLLRDAKIAEAIFELLTQQYEQAKIMEAKDTPTVQYLDRAGPPEKKSYPKRTLIVVFAFLLSTLGSVLLAFFSDYLDETKANPQEHRVLSKLITTVSHDYTTMKDYLRRRYKKTKQ